MSIDYYISDVSDNDALSLEYKLLNRHALREADVSDFIGDSALKGFLRTQVCHVEALGSQSLRLD